MKKVKTYSHTERSAEVFYSMIKQEYTVRTNTGIESTTPDLDTALSIAQSYVEGDDSSVSEPEYTLVDSGSIVARAKK